MKRYARALALAVCALGVTSTTAAQQIGAAAPKLEAVKWYNTPPLSLEAMNKKAVLVEVFRTW